VRVLTGEERFVIRVAFEAGFTVTQAAERVGRSRRTVERLFASYGGKQCDRKPPRELPAPPPKPLRNPARFYASEFEPT
jgi:hypothetical protein